MNDHPYFFIITQIYLTALKYAETRYVAQEEDMIVLKSKYGYQADNMIYIDRDRGNLKVVF